MFKKRGRGGYGARRNGNKGGGRTTPYKKGQNNGGKVVVSNLDAQVSENDVKEIFQKIGRVVKTMLNFDSNGRSRGTGEIVFASRNLAIKAVEEYNRAEVDGRPMYLKLLGGTPKKASVKKPVVKKKSTKKEKPQVQNKKKSKKKPQVQNKKKSKKKPQVQSKKKSKKKPQVQNKKKSKKKSVKKSPKKKSNKKKANGKKGKGRVAKKKPTPLTAAQLDEEMELYHKKGGGTTKSVEQLDREMELYHIRAGQPPPQKSEPVAMDEAEE